MAMAKPWQIHIEKHQDTVSNEDLSHGCPLALILLYLTFLREVLSMCTYLYVLFYPVELGRSCLLYRLKPRFAQSQETGDKLGWERDGAPCTYRC